jgi:type VI secretion system protein ImpG
LAFNKHYYDELMYLRELGEEFSKAYPRLAPFLSAKGKDPDVQRLLEGFAFIAGRLRQKLDDELPELTHSLISILWPPFLRPIPAMSILQFTPIPNAVSERMLIPRGVAVDSVPVEGTRCRFETCFEVDLRPLEVESVELRRDATGQSMRLAFRPYGGIFAENLGLDSLRFHLAGELSVCQSLYLWLARELKEVRVEVTGPAGEKRSFSLPARCVKPVGFSEDEAVIPYPPNGFAGYRLLQEYFALPQKFLFFDVAGLGTVASVSKTGHFSLIFEFAKPFEGPVRVGKENLLLHCTPVINLQPRDADPIRLDQREMEYRVRPSGADASHFEIYSVDKVEGWVRGTGKRRPYQPFLSFDRPLAEGDEEEIFYRVRIRPAAAGRGVDTYLSFVQAGKTASPPAAETVSTELTVTNRNLPEKLRRGDIRVPTGSSPEFAEFDNVLPPTLSLAPPLGDGLEWKLISNMSLNQLSLANVESLRAILSVYNFAAHYDRQARELNSLRMEGIRKAAAEPSVHVFRGLPVRGTQVEMEIDSAKFSGLGEAYLFSSILNEFFSLYATINSFHRLRVRDVDRGEEYRWPPRIGEKTLL